MCIHTYIPNTYVLESYSDLKIHGGDYPTICAAQDLMDGGQSLRLGIDPTITHPSSIRCLHSW